MSFSSGVRLRGFGFPAFYMSACCRKDTFTTTKRPITRRETLVSQRAVAAGLPVKALELIRPPDASNPFDIPGKSALRDS